jgi:hypothetical protein
LRPADHRVVSTAGKYNFTRLSLFFKIGNGVVKGIFLSDRPMSSSGTSGPLAKQIDG